MNTASSQTYVMAEEFDKVLKLVRRALAERDLSITDELDTTESPHRDSGKKPKPSRLLLVDSPLLTFEAMALDRAAGALIPMHVLISSDGDQTHIIFVEPATLFARRLPVGAAGPLEQLKARIRGALESAVAQSEARHRQLSKPHEFKICRKLRFLGCALFHGAAGWHS